MLTSVLFICVSVWVLLTALLYFMQPHFVYYPSTTVAYDPGDLGLEFEDLMLETADGVRVHAWFIPRPQAHHTLLFLHGNAGNIGDRLEFIRIFYDLGLSILILDYRGYGRSEGNPSEDGTYHDAQAAWNFLTAERGLDPRHIVIYGQSLGGAVAAWLAARVTAGALILDSTFTSIVDMGRHHYPYLPVRWMARIRYPAIDQVSRIRSPVLVIHSHEDEIVPFEQGQALFAAANPPKSFLEIHGGHNDGFYRSLDRYVNGIRSFLEANLPK